MSQDAKKWPPIQLIPQPPLATVKIVSDETASGFIIVNASDFDPNTMKKFVESKAAKTESK